MGSYANTTISNRLTLIDAHTFFTQTVHPVTNALTTLRNPMFRPTRVAYRVMRSIAVRIVSIEDKMVEANLSLGLLLRSHDLEVARVERLLGLLCGAGASLLGDFGPAAACRLVFSRRGCVALIDDALVSQLAAAEEFLGEVAGIDGVRGRVNRLGD